MMIKISEVLRMSRRNRDNDRGRNTSTNSRGNNAAGNRNVNGNSRGNNNNNGVGLAATVNRVVNNAVGSGTAQQNHNRGNNATGRNANTNPRGNSVGNRNANVRGNNNGIGLGGVAASVAVASVVNRVVNNTMQTNNQMNAMQQNMNQAQIEKRPSKVRALKEITDRTGVSLSEANNAYERNNFDIEAAIRELTGLPPLDPMQSQQMAGTMGCPSCRMQNPIHAKFCSNCGGGMEPITEQQTPAIEAQQPPVPQNCSGCKANLIGETGNACPYCRKVFR